MSCPYSVYLAGRELSDHETFVEALREYAKIAHLTGANMRNSDRADMYDNGLTEDERCALAEVSP